MILDAPNINRLWTNLIVEELVRSGVTHAFLAPGSRSTPLTTAIAAHPGMSYTIHFDERGTAFAALGYGRATGRPAVWVTTSGTAVANAMPAVVEAATDGVPMLLLTADRPPELRETGANQTIRQPHLFGEHIRWFFDLPTPSPDIDPAMVLTTIDQAVYRAQHSTPGPVHLNAMFREPLAPEEQPFDLPHARQRLQSWADQASPYTTYGTGHHAPDADTLARISALLEQAEYGIIVAGQLRHPSEGDALLRLSEHLRWPLLADVQSGVRLGGGAAATTLIPYFDLLLSDTAFAETQAPDCVLHVGRRATSKRYLQWLNRSRPRHLIVAANTPERLDPTHQVTQRIIADPTLFADALRQAVTPSGRTAYLDAWRDANQQAARVIAGRLSEASEISEPGVARAMSQEIPASHALVLASSMPVRDVDMFADPSGAPVHVLANRGASGIDGTIATAVGAAIGRQSGVSLLIGDLATLHDLNSLALLRDTPVVLVVINNDGGGIFSFLPIAKHTDLFEPLFGTPHGLTFADAAAMMGLAYHAPITMPDFRKAYRHACDSGRAAIMEVRTDRSANHALHQDILAALRTALSA